MQWLRLRNVSIGVGSLTLTFHTGWLSLGLSLESLRYHLHPRSRPQQWLRRVKKKVSYCIAVVLSLKSL